LSSTIHQHWPNHGTLLIKTINMTDFRRPENDFKSAFDSLKTSTAAIEKHSKIIEAQREALLAFRPQNSAAQGPDSTSRRHDQESSQLVFAVRINSTVQNLSC
jgi:hypothetical protein